MVDECGFESIEQAAEFRTPYFTKYHSSLKMLTVAGEEQALPPNPDGSARTFDPNSLATYMAEKCEFDKYLTPCPATNEALGELKAAGLKMVIFTNGPRKYALRVMEQLEIMPYFEPELIFAVEDVMPHCKPELEAFQKVFDAAGVTDASTSVMFEDSMKNVKGAKKLGMRTVLMLASQDGSGDQSIEAPDPDDPAVDVVLSTTAELKTKLACLWDKEWRP